MCIKNLYAYVALLAVCICFPALAKPSAIGVVDAWAPPSLSQSAGVAYITLRNDATSDDVLTHITANAITDQAELHTHKTDARGVVRMRRLKAMALPARGVLVMTPGAKHLMFFALKKPLRDGENFQVTCYFKHAAPLVIRVPISTARLLEHIKAR